MTLKIIKSRISKFTITFLLSLLLLAPVSQAKNFDEKINKYQPRIDLDYKWGNERNLGSLNLFIPVLQNSDNLLFIDSRGWLDNNNTKEGNIGLGFRRKINNELLLGAYAFYDAKSTKNDNKFIQGTFGIEALTINWDFRTNLYLAEKDRKNTNSSIVGGIYIQGSNIIDGSQSYETNFDGFDIEVGRKMPFLEDLTMSVSYYHFRNNNVDEKIDGYRARGKYSFFSKNGHSLSLEGQYSYDNLRSDEFLGGIKYSYQFGKSGKDNNRKNQLSAIEKRMTAEVIRDVDIVTKENAADPTTLKSANGEDQKILFVNNEAGGIQEGTMENPFKTLKDAEAASGEYDIIYVYYGDGTTSGYDDGIVLKDYQKLFGQGDDFTIGDVLGNQSYGEVLIAKESDDSYSKITKTFNGGDDTYIEHVTSLSNVETYTIMAANYNVITGVDVSSNNIDDSKLYDYGNGILILNKTGVIINNNKIHDNASHGVYVFNVGLTTSSNTISNNKISDNLQQGIRLIASGSSTQNNNISDNVISDNLGHGISSSSYWLATQNNVISKNLISNNLKRGIHLRSDHNSKQNSKISDNDISNNSAAGIRIASADFSSQNNEISRNSISNNLQDGIRLIYNSDNIFNIKLQNNNMNDNTGFDLRSVLYASSTTPIIDLGVGSLGSLGGNSFNRVVGFYKEAPDTISISAKNNYWGLGSSTLINGFNTIDDSDKLLSNPFID